MNFTLSFRCAGDTLVIRAQPPQGLQALQTARTVLRDPSLTIENMGSYIQDTRLGVTGFKVAFPVPVAGQEDAYEIQQRRIDLALDQNTASRCGGHYETAAHLDVVVPPNGLRAYLSFTPRDCMRARGRVVGWKAEIAVDQILADWMRAGCPLAWNPEAPSKTVGVWLQDGTMVYKLRESRGRGGRPEVENEVYLSVQGPLPEADRVKLAQRVCGFLTDEDRRRERAIEQADKDAKLEAAQAEVRRQHPRANLSFGSWECEESPTGQCVYDMDSDMGDDECLYCGGPDERK